MTVRMALEITGVVQGVGFRPAVARIAAHHHLTGYVCNTAGTVHCEFEGSGPAVDAAIIDVRAGPTPLARISRIRVEPMAPTGSSEFTIAPSRAGTAGRTLIPADVATCAHCLAEMRDPGNRRYRHPFITCTDCGPRYTVITDLPYDRAQTTMNHFSMCSRCAAEYADPQDRRFHAETIACRDCGPRLEFRLLDARPSASTPTREPSSTDPIGAAADALLTGKIVAIKGIGGYHLACRADDNDAVAELRSRKHRPAKPFALMVGSVEVAAGIIEHTDTAVSALASPAAPVVIAPRRSGSPGVASAVPAGAPIAVADGVAPDIDDLGIMLAYSPIHHLLFERLGAIPLVMTSANVGGSPIAYRDGDVAEMLGGIADAVLTHDRPIAVPCEDSVLRVCGTEVVPLRRSRGWAPLPVDVGVAPAAPILATGGDLKTTFCLLDEAHDAGDGPRGLSARAHLSAHLGDMSDPRTQAVFAQALDRLESMTGARGASIATDMHPGYATTAWARRHAAGREVIAVQHHHAHAAALLAEHDALGTPVVIAVFDGTGYGTDGVIWGGEILALGADPAMFTRVAHVAEFALPGADNAIREPARVALDLLWRSGITEVDDLIPAREIGPARCAVLAQLHAKSARGTPVGYPATTSMGRLWDAVAALLGICTQVTYEGQAAVELDSCARRGRASAVPTPVGGEVIEHGPIITRLVAGLRRGERQSDLAATFTAWVVEATSVALIWAARTAGTTVVGLSGGVFVNDAVRCGIRDRLQASGCRVLTHRIVPPNDGGLALGQACVAAVQLGGTSRPARAGADCGIDGARVGASRGTE